MTQSNIPALHQTVMPYLMVEGAPGLIDFLVSVFGGQETERHMRDEKLIAHAEVRIGGSTIMLSDSTTDWRPQTAGLFIYVTDADQTYAKALGAGATSIMEPADQVYGRSCGVTDPCGNVWWITTAPQAAQ